MNGTLLESIDSELIEAYPAVKRNSSYYTSRLLSEDNFKRSLFLQSNTEDSDGSRIISYSLNDNNALTEIEFTIHGYYFHTVSSDERQNELIDTLNNYMSTTSAYNVLRLSISQESIGHSGEEEIFNFNEMSISDAKSTTDDNLYFKGMYFQIYRDSSSETVIDPIGIDILIGDPATVSVTTIAPMVLNPFISDKSYIDTTNNIFINNKSPYFICDETLANMSITLKHAKNRIWVDNTYYVPHVYNWFKSESTDPNWIPLGATYKDYVS